MNWDCGEKLAFVLCVLYMCHTPQLHRQRKKPFGRSADLGLPNQMLAFKFGQDVGLKANCSCIQWLTVNVSKMMLEARCQCIVLHAQVQARQAASCAPKTSARLINDRDFLYLSWCGLRDTDSAEPPAFVHEPALFLLMRPVCFSSCCNKSCCSGCRRFYCYS